MAPHALLLPLLLPFLPPQDADSGADEPPARRYELDPLLVTPTLSAERRFDAPYAASEVPRSTLEERAYRTLPQALRDVPGVMVQETGPGQGSPYLRGFTGFRNVLLIDGVRLNNSVFREGPNQYWSTIDPFTIERLEAAMGPASVLYGSDAIGGAVQVHTPSAWSGLEDGRWHARVRALWADAENHDQGRVEAFGPLGAATAVRLGLSSRHFGDVHGGEDVGLQRETGYDEAAADVKIEHELDPDTRLVVAHQRVDQDDAPRTHATIHGIDWEGLTHGSDLRRDLDQERRLTYAELEAQDLDGWFDRLVTNLSWHEQDEVQHRTRSSGAQDDQGFAVDTLGFFTHLFRETPAGRWTWGLDFYHDSVDSFLDRFENQSDADDIQGPVGDDATYDLLGLFVQDELDLSERTRLTLGARWNHAAADADEVRDPVTDERISIEDDWQALVGSVRVAHELVPERWNLYAGLSQGFRAPNLSDLSRFDNARTDEFEIPAPDLDPEYTTTFEVGAKAKGDDGSAQLALFYTDVRDQIVRKPTGNVNGDGEFEVTRDNSGDGYVYGVELDAVRSLDERWSVFGNVTYLQGRIDGYPTSAPETERDHVSRLMPTTVHLGTRWEPVGSPAWVEGMITWADEASRLSPGDEGDTSRIPPGGTPGYVVIDLRSGARLARDLELTVGVENVLDEDYRIHGSGLNRPGRNLYFGLTWSF